MPEQDASAGGGPPQLEEYFAGVATSAAKPYRRRAGLGKQDGASADVFDTDTSDERGEESPGDSGVTVFENTSEHGDVATASLKAAPSPEKVQIAKLNRLVAEKDHALLRAELAAQELETKLAQEQQESLNLRNALISAKQAEDEDPGANGIAPAAPPGQELSPDVKAEVDKQRKEWSRIQKSLEREHNRRKTELATVRAQWFQTQQQLDAESRGRRMEAAQASAAIAKLERDLTSANGTIAQSYASDSKAAAVKKMMTVAVITVVLLLGGGLAWTQLSLHTQSAHAGGPGVSSMSVLPSAENSTDAGGHPAAGQAVSNPVAAVSKAPQGGYTLANSSFSQAGFQTSLSQLNRALSSFGNRSPEDILNEARKRTGDASICAFQWNKGQPALLFGSEGLKETLAKALSRCAVAVERIPH